MAILIETENKSTTINRITVIEDALRCPHSNVANPEKEIDQLRGLMISVAQMGEKHARNVLDIAHEVWTDVRIARIRVLGVWDPIFVVGNRDKKGKVVDSTTYVVTYADKLSQQLRDMSMNGTRNMAIVVANQMQERINLYLDTKSVNNLPVEEM